MPARSFALRTAALCVYAGVGALTEAAAARPALLYLRGVGFSRAVLPAVVPAGAAFAVIACAAAAATLVLAVGAAARVRVGLFVHALLLTVCAAACGLRSTAEAPRPGPDPLPRLLEGLQAAAADLDAGTASQASLDRALAAVGDSPFVLRGQRLPLRAKVLANASGPQLAPLAVDEPGTIYVALAPDRHRAWLTALSLGGLARLPSGKIALVEQRGTAHTLPGRDPLIPAYPGMRTIAGSFDAPAERN
jgi:hypothetical protein